MRFIPQDVRAKPFSHIPLWLVRAAAVAGCVALLALSMPLVWAAVSAGAGLLTLTAMAIGGVALFQALPWAGQRLENGLLKLRKAEARANPIEQLQNEMLRRASACRPFAAHWPRSGRRSNPSRRCSTSAAIWTRAMCCSGRNARCNA